LIEIFYYLVILSFGVGFLEGEWVVLVGFGLGFLEGEWVLTLIGFLFGFGLEGLWIGVWIGAEVGVWIGAEVGVWIGAEVGVRIGAEVQAARVGKASSPIWRVISEL